MAWAPDYVTLAEFRAYATDSEVTVDDATIALAVTAASRAVDRHTRRQFGLVAAPEARAYTAWWDTGRRRWVIPIDDLMTTLGLTVATSTGTVDVYDLKPANAAVEGMPWTRLVVDPTSAVKPTADEDSVTVTAQFGWTEVPVTVKQATMLQANRFFKRKDAPFGVAGSPQIGSELRLLAKVDPDVAVVLAPYTRLKAKVA